MAVLTGLMAAGFARPVAGEELITAVSSDSVSIESTFTGAEIVLFGTIERDVQTVARPQGYDIVIVTRGPKQQIVVRRKSRLAGIWVNRESRHYVDAPSYLAILSNRPLADIADPLVLSRFQLSLEQLILFESSTDAAAPAPQATIFHEALLRLMRQRAHYVEDPSGVAFLSPTLFKANIPLPASVPVGEYRAEVYLLGDGALLAQATKQIRIRKAGVEQLVTLLASEMPLLYGLVAVVLAIFSGWLAGIVFRRD
jgi:uncharacterized protein (TIGR02186 family)